MKKKNFFEKFCESRLVPIIAFALPIVIVGMFFLLNSCSKEKVPERDIDRPIITETTKQQKSTEPKIKVTKEERELLARLVSCEASICSSECKRDVVSVVFNRLDSGKWGDTIEDVIFYPNAFTPATSGKIYSEIPNKDCYSAVDYVLKNGTTLPTEVRYFRTDYDFSWENYQNYKVLDNVYFGYFTNWRNGQW